MSNSSFRGIKTKLTVGITALLFIGFAAINIINFSVSKTSVRHGILYNALPLVSDNIYSRIQNDLIAPINVSSLMANDTFLKDWVLDGEKDLALITKYLHEIKKRYHFVTAFYVSDTTKKYYHYRGILKTVSRDDDHDVWYYRFKDLNVPYEMDVDTDEAAQGRLTIFINHRLNDYDGRFLGVTGVGLAMNRVGGLLAEYGDLYGKTLYLVDAAGVIQVHPDESLIEKVNILEQEGIKDVAGDFIGTHKRLSVYEYDRNGRHIILLARYIPEFNWFLIVEQVENIALADIRANFIRNLFLGLLVTVLVAVIIVVMINYFQGQLESMATTDELTKAHNRRAFFDLGQREFSQHRRYGHPLSMLMIDIDHFKGINDEFGHDAGDRVLRSVTDIIRDGIREMDILARTGGEEFAVLMPQTRQDDAYKAGERIRKAVAGGKTVLPGNQLVQCTISIGVSEADHATTNLEHLLKKADMAMYEAKRQGRNVVCSDSGISCPDPED